MTNERHAQEHTCNVVFHGTFTYVPRGDIIQALIPWLPQHCNRAGNWLGETDLRGGVYKLIGVRGGNAEFDPKKNLIVKYGELPEHPKPHVRLILPRPRDIKSLRVAELPREAFEHADELLTQTNAQHVATLQIFTYGVESDKALQLQSLERDCGHYWEPVLTDGYVSLHIFSSEDHPEDPVVQSGDLAACAELLGVRLRLKPGFTYAASGIGPDDVVPPGVNARETENLEPRTIRMARLGRLVTQKGGGDANHAWYEDDALDNDPPACGPLVGVPKKGRS